VITVLTVDDDAEMRKAARALVAAAAGFESVGEVGSGEEAIEAVMALEPQLVLVDEEMPGLDGHETANRLRQARPDTVVVVITPDNRAALTPGTLQEIWEDRHLG